MKLIRIRLWFLGGGTSGGDSLPFNERLIKTTEVTKIIMSTTLERQAQTQNGGKTMVSQKTADYFNRRVREEREGKRDHLGAFDKALSFIRQSVGEYR